MGKTYRRIPRDTEFLKAKFRNSAGPMISKKRELEKEREPEVSKCEYCGKWFELDELMDHFEGCNNGEN